MTATPRTETPHPAGVRPSRSNAVGITLSGLTVVWIAVAASRWTGSGILGRDLWLIGVAALSLAAAVQQFRPGRGSAWLLSAALGLLTVLLFVSGASKGGSFLMWSAGSATLLAPAFLWAMEPDAEAAPLVEVADDEEFNDEMLELAAAA